MKNFKNILVLILVIVICNSANAADYKIGYVDIAKILNESPAAKAAQKKLEQEFTPRNKQLESKAKKIQKQKEKLQKEADIMSKDQIESLKRKIMKSESYTLISISKRIIILLNVHTYVTPFTCKTVFSSSP